MSKVTIPADVVKVGAAMIADGRTETAWKFYRGVAAVVPETLEGKALTSVLDNIRARLIAAKFGKVDLTADEARASKVPSVGTLKRRLADVRPTMGRDLDTLPIDAVSVEAFGHVYRSPLGDKDTDKALNLVAAYMDAHEGHGPSVREARDGFGREAKVRSGEASDGGPATVGEMVEYLLSQPKAVAVYVAENPEVAAALATMLTTATAAAA